MSESTQRIDDPELTARMQARELKDKENLSLAEKLILASADDQFKYTYKGVDVEVYAPTQKEFETILTLFNSVMTNASVPSGTSKEKRAEIEKGVASSIDKLFRLVSSLCVDDSISFELLKSGRLGTSFIPKFVNEVTQREQELAQDITRFRKSDYGEEFAYRLHFFGIKYSEWEAMPQHHKLYYETVDISVYKNALIALASMVKNK